MEAAKVSFLQVTFKLYIQNQCWLIDKKYLVIKDIDRQHINFNSNKTINYNQKTLTRNEENDQILLRSDSKYNALITMLDILTHINLYDKGSILNKCFFIKKDHSVRV